MPKNTCHFSSGSCQRAVYEKLGVNFDEFSTKKEMWFLEILKTKKIPKWRKDVIKRSLWLGAIIDYEEQYRPNNKYLPIYYKELNYRNNEKDLKTKNS